MIKVLSIGNSFSQDAQRYLHQIAANEGVDLMCENLCIGGCWLAKHWENIQTNASDYELEINGCGTGAYISVQDALQKEAWDYVTIQQVSSEAFCKESYIPFAELIAGFIRKYAPTARIYLHQTWAYEADSDKLRSVGFPDAHRMLAQIRDACAYVAQAIGADGIIPSGEAMMLALEAGISRIHRDTYHAELGVGRYLLGCLWFMALTGKDITGDTIALDAQVDENDIRIAGNAARTALKNEMRKNVWQNCLKY